MDPHILLNHFNGFDLSECGFQVEVAQFWWVWSSDNEGAELKEGEHATVTNGVGLKAQMKAFSLGGHADDGEHKASQGSQ